MTAKIITVFNQKGGCGKTMTAMQLGGTFGAMGLKVFIVDMDPQNTAALWALEADTDVPFPAQVLSYAPLKEAFTEKLDPLLEKFDVIIIDTPPAIESDVPWVALCSSDFAIIPVMPVLDNIWASRQAEQLVEKAQAENPALDGAYLICNVRRGTVFDLCLQKLSEKARLPILETKIKTYNAFPESQVYGCVVSAFGASAATDQMRQLAKEVASKLKLQLKKAN